MVPLGFSYRQQIVQQAPEGFDWQVLPAPAGADGLTQGVSPQTLSVAEDSPHKKEAAEFIDFLLRPENMVRLALGDWMLPTGTEALKSPALRTQKNGWATGTALAAHLRSAPAQSVRGYPEWKDKVATPAFQELHRQVLDAIRAESIAAAGFGGALRRSARRLRAIRRPFRCGGLPSLRCRALYHRRLSAGGRRHPRLDHESP
jgi:ABC-type glycerol-3-phosphate transport system substrate-binding protein